MTDPTEAVLQYLQHVGAGLDPDFLREAIKVMSALLMEVEVQQRIGADHYERTDQRTTYRNGYRDRAWNTRVGGFRSRFPNCARGAISRACSNPDGERNRHCSQ